MTIEDDFLRALKNKNSELLKELSKLPNAEEFILEGAADWMGKYGWSREHAKEHILSFALERSLGKRS